MTRPSAPHLSRRLVACCAAVVAIGALTACQAGQTAQTSQPYNPADGRNVNVPENATFDDNYVGIRNAVVVATGDIGSLLVTMVNNSDEDATLEGVRIDDQAMTLSRPVVIAPGATAKAGFDSDLQITVDPLSPGVGDWVTVEFSFVEVGTSTFDVLVVPYGDDYVSDDSEAPLVIPTPVEGGAEVFEAEAEPESEG